MTAFHTSAPAEEKKKDAAVPSSGGGFLGTGLSPLYAIPVGIVAAIPILTHEMLILNAESQLVACFTAFVITAYTQGGDAIGKNLDDRAAAVTAEHNAVEDANIAAVTAVISAHKTRLSLLEDVQAIHKAGLDVRQTLERAKTGQLKWEMKDSVEGKLNSLIAREQARNERLTARLTANSTATVTDNFTKDAKAKGAALDAALAVLRGDKAAAAIDPIPKMYSQYFKELNVRAAASVGKPRTLSDKAHKAISDEIKAIQKKEGLENLKYEYPKVRTSA